MAKNKAEGPSPLDVHISRRLVFLRNQQQVTQKELAEALAVTFQQIQKYEGGRNRLSAASLYRAVKALDSSVGAFFKGYVRLDDPPPVDLNDPMIAECADLLGELGRDGRLACRSLPRVMTGRPA